MPDRIGDCKKVHLYFLFHLVISSDLLKYHLTHSLYCCLLPTLGNLVLLNLAIEMQITFIFISMLLTELQCPRYMYWGQCGGFDEK